jgi:hypothetical protein
MRVNIKEAATGIFSTGDTVELMGKPGEIIQVLEALGYTPEEEAEDEPEAVFNIGALDISKLTVTGPEWEEVAPDDLKAGDEVRVKFPSWERYEERGVLHTRRGGSLWLNKDDDYVIDASAMYSSIQRKVK